MNLIELNTDLTKLISGINNGLIHAPAIDPEGLSASQSRLTSMALLPGIDGHTTADDLERLDDNEQWIIEAENMATGLLRRDLDDLPRMARLWRSCEAWIEAVRRDNPGAMA